METTGDKNIFLFVRDRLDGELKPGVLKAADDVPRITIQELKAKMDSGEKIVILDVRSGEDYKAARLK